MVNLVAVRAVVDKSFKSLRSFLSIYSNKPPYWSVCNRNLIYCCWTSPRNHSDLESIEWLERYLKDQDVPMVIVSHDRALLDQLCTKIVETDMGVAQTFPGNYSEFVPAKAAWVEMQHMSWEKQQKEIARSEEIIQRLSSGANSGRATSAAKQLKIMQDEGQKVEKPFQRKPVMFRFPELKCSGKKVVEIKKLGYHHDVKRCCLRMQSF